MIPLALSGDRLTPWERHELVTRIRLSPASLKSILQALNKRQGSNRDCFPSLPTIGREAGCSRSTVKRGLRFLEEIQLIAISEVDGYRRYQIHDVELTRLCGDGLIVAGGGEPGCRRGSLWTGGGFTMNPGGVHHEPQMQTDECRQQNEEALPDWIIVARRAAYGVLGPAGLQLDADLLRAADLSRVCECLAIVRYRANESPIGYFKKAIRERYQANRRERAFAAQLVRACYIQRSRQLSDPRDVPEGADGCLFERPTNASHESREDALPARDRKAADEVHTQRRGPDASETKDRGEAEKEGQAKVENPPAIRTRRAFSIRPTWITCQVGLFSPPPTDQCGDALVGIPSRPGTGDEAA